VTDFNKPVEELMKERLQGPPRHRQGLDRDSYIRQAQFKRGTPCFGSVNPAMAAYFDADLATSSSQTFDLAAARKLMADAGYPMARAFRSCGC